jgi:putative spermidine/putrescine transport system permease protein
MGGLERRGRADRPGVGAGPRRAVARLLLSPLGLVTFFLVPAIVTIMFSSVATGQAGKLTYGVGNYLRFIRDPYYRHALAVTAEMSIVTTLCALLVGYAIAFQLIRLTRSRFLRRLGYLIVVAPLFTSSIVRSFGWLVTLGNNGLVNRALLGLRLIDRPMHMVFNETGVIIALVHILLPFMVLAIAAVLQNIHPSLEEAAMDLGADPLTTFATITLPLSAPGIVAGSLIVFTLAMSSYVTPSVLGGGHLKVVPMLIYEQYMAVFDWGFGAAMAIILLGLTLLMTLVSLRVVRAA